MKHTACGEELERLFKESEERRRCLHPNSRSVEKALLRRVEAKEVYSPYPGLFERSCWSAQEYRRLVATRVIKTLAELHPEWIFTSFSAALMYGLWVPYSRLNPIRICAPNAPYRRRSKHLWVSHLAPTDVHLEGEANVTGLCQTLLESALDAPVHLALPTIDSALRYLFISREDLLEYAQREGCRRRGIGRARAAFAHADGESENGGESMVRGIIIELGFMPPTMLQVEFPDPLNQGHVYRVDMLWELDGGRCVIGEVDGARKYKDADCLKGKTTQDVLVEERQRESRLTALGMPVMRVLVRQIFEPGYMESLLEAFGIPRIGPGVR